MQHGGVMFFWLFTTQWATHAAQHIQMETWQHRKCAMLTMQWWPTDMQSWVVQLITHCQWPLKGKACGKQAMTPSNDYCLFAVAFFLRVSLWTSWAACQAEFIWEDLSKHCYRLSPHMQSFLAVRLFRQCTTSLFVSTLLASRQDLYCSISLMLSHLTCRGVSEHAEVFFRVSQISLLLYI